MAKKKQRKTRRDTTQDTTVLVVLKFTMTKAPTTAAERRYITACVEDGDFTALECGDTIGALGWPRVVSIFPVTHE